MSAWLPDSLEMMARACDVLSEPRHRCRWQAPERIPLTTPNNEPVGALVWDSQQHTYRVELIPAVAVAADFRTHKRPQEGER